MDPRQLHIYNHTIKRVELFEDNLEAYITARKVNQEIQLYPLVKVIQVLELSKYLKPSLIITSISVGNESIGIYIKGWKHDGQK